MRKRWEIRTIYSNQPSGLATISDTSRKWRVHEDDAAEMKQYLESLGDRKDGAYEERNKVVSALARLFPSGITKTAIEGWDEEWHGCVYIDLPTGQVSWHFHDSQAYLFEGLPLYDKSWDGHDTEEKYRRLAALS